jgi:hypothetical protein
LIQTVITQSNQGQFFEQFAAFAKRRLHAH